MDEKRTLCSVTVTIRSIGALDEDTRLSDGCIRCAARRAAIQAPATTGSSISYSLADIPRNTIITRWVCCASDPGCRRRSLYASIKEPCPDGKSAQTRDGKHHQTIV